MYDENYFLSFVEDDSKKIAYAPSMGLPTIENKYIESNIKKWVEKIGVLSVREEQAKNILQNLTKREIEVVLDPTFLLTKEQWNKMFNLNQKEKNDYILFYCLGGNKKYYKIAKKIAKILKKELKVIPGTIEDYNKQNMINASPEEFLKLIYNAHMVLTDSFHGTIFSINFNVPFITFKRFKDNNLSQNSRIYNILEKVNLKNRIYNNNLKFFLHNQLIDFTKCDNIIEKERIKSSNFLKKALENQNSKVESERITNVCTGCGMCAAVCPTHAIEVELNNKGFYEYKINNKKCIKCGLCKKVCGQLNSEANELNKMKLYSAYSLNKNVLKQSSSGGIAHELSLLSLENKIPVIGCTYNVETKRAEHIVITKKEELEKLDGSKYIQSYTVEALEKIKNMDKGLIIGTPCQIAAIDRYLKLLNKRDKFILVDLICHGVPTYYLWNQYIKQFKEVNQVKFRDKKYGWRNITLTINKTNSEKENKCLFYHFFELCNVYNTSCYNCRYRTKTLADIRIGDYWGEKFKNNKIGMSMVIVNTNVGDEAVKKLEVEKRIYMKEQKIEDYFLSQQIQNAPIPLLYDQIIDELKDENNSLSTLSKKYCQNELKYEKIKKIVFNIYYKIKRK